MKKVLTITSVRGLSAASARIAHIFLNPQSHRIHFFVTARKGTQTILYTCTYIFANDRTYNPAPARVRALVQFYVRLKSLKRCANFSWRLCKGFDRFAMLYQTLFDGQCLVWVPWTHYAKENITGHEGRQEKEWKTWKVRFLFWFYNIS